MVSDSLFRYLGNVMKELYLEAFWNDSIINSERLIHFCPETPKPLRLFLKFYSSSYRMQVGTGSEVAASKRH